MRRGWSSIPLAMLFALGLSMPAWANSELHPAGRLFFPLWDVSSANRLTFIIVTREALNEGQSIRAELVATANTTKKVWRVVGTGNCLPRGAGGSDSDVNRTDLGGTKDTPVFVDDLHFEYYGRSCTNADEIVHMSCADIDLFLLSSSSNSDNKPRNAFEAVANEGRGALDVNLVVNGDGSPTARKEENSLMGHAIISDLAEGWAAVYPAAAAKATFCALCELTGGTAVGYENYPMEVFLPFALADPFPAPGGGVRNILSLWGPGLFPGDDLAATSISLDIKWWDGRERFFTGSIGAHSAIRPLGGATLAGLDAPIDPSRFNVASFVCGHATGANAENDGFPRTGSSSTACGAPGNPETVHLSDNFESSADLSDVGHTIQTSTPIGWWRFSLNPGGRPPIPGGENSGRGLVGVVLSSTPGADAVGVGDATRLWHKDPCKLAQTSRTLGPPHLRDGGVWSNKSGLFAPGDLVSLFNVFTLDDQEKICAGLFTGGDGALALQP